MRRFLAEALKIVNAVLGCAGVKLVRAKPAGFDIALAVRRAAGHGFPIRSVIDIGASDGKWSVESMKAFPQASFVAVEPLRERQGALEKLKQSNPLFDYVLAVGGDKDGQPVTLTVTADLDGSTVDGAGGESRSVPMRTLDSIVAEKKLQGPFMIKFDTHGYELPILAGAVETLRNTRVIVMEVYNFKITDHALRFHEMCAHLEQLGFRCYDIADPLLRDHDRALWQMDLLFARSDDKIFAHPNYG